MHLKLVNHLSHLRPVGSLTTLLAVLVSLQTLQTSASASQHWSSGADLANQRRENLTQHKCQPVLNFALPQVDYQKSSFDNSKRSESTGRQAQKLSQSIPESFSFAIGDINLPLTQTGGTEGQTNGGAVQAAMKLLAAFDAQLYGDMDEDGERESEEQNVVRFKQNRLFLSGLNFTMLNVHLYQESEPRFAIGVNIANTTLVGQFQYDGFAPASLISSDYAKMAGHYRMSIDNILLTAASNLTKRFVDEPSVKHKYNLASNELRLNISNLGYISIDILDAKDSTRPTSNYVLKMLQRVLQKTIKRTYNKFEDYIRQTLELEGRQFLDCELTRFSPLLTENLKQDIRQLKTDNSSLTVQILNTTLDNLSRSNITATYLDDLAKIISTEMSNSHLDRISLPDFEYQRSVFGSSADISFQNGSLVGLDNIKLNGETRVKLLEEHLIVNASIGWRDLRPQYNWTLYFGSGSQESSDRRSSNATDLTANATNSPPLTGQLQPQKSQKVHNNKPMANGFVAFNIKAIDFDAVISKSVRSQSQMVVDELVIRRLDNPKMDIGGLPGMNRLTRGAVNFFMGRLKQRLVSSIQPALKQELERTLNRLAVFN